MPSAPQRTIWAAFAISLALHAVLFSELPGLTFTDPPVRATLNAELQRPAPPAPPLAPKPAPRPVAKPAPPPAVAKPAPAPEAPSIPVARIPESVAPAPVPEADAVAEPDPAPVAESSPAPEPPEPAPAPTVAETRPAPEPLDVEASSGTITYELFYGGGSIGRSVQTWRIDRASYRLTSLSEPVGLVALFLPYEYAYTSEGRIGPEGLQPEHFTARSGRGGSRRAAATFDWVKKEITFGTAGAPHTQALPAGTQDLLSFVYQIALSPDVTPGKRRMVITSGTKVDTYVLDVGEEEAIDLPIGPMRAIPVRRITAPGEEGMQLWLAAAPPRVPVRIRFFDRTGKMTIEQLAAKIERHES